MPLPPRLRHLLALFAPRRAAVEARRVAAKLGRRLRRRDAAVVTLSPAAEPRGDVLVSYILDGFLLPPGAPLPHRHTHYWESVEIARTFVDLGYRVDAVSWQNRGFAITKPYRAVVDVRLNLERWVPQLPAGCVKILHAETAHRSVHNPAQERRLAELYERRGVRLEPRKMLEPNRAIESADCAVVLGNDFTLASYGFAGKPLFRVPISAPLTYPELDRDIAACRRRFLWFGSGGLVHKGLDRVLEAFAGMPDFQLTVCGPVERERDFERAYYRELYDTPNIRTQGWIDVASPHFLELARRTLGLVYPSCSEGGGGGVLTCMHAGIVPLVTREASVDVEAAYGVVLADAGVETIRGAVRSLSERPVEELARMAAAARDFARRRHTRESFSRHYRRAVEEILGRFPGGDR